ncbi:spermatogenesis-associated protein 9-like isoform X2 [Mobula birostris]|uniref:spermatogenesis-associated protein 9-like isoform X2 n=1 Tax=Mobula birostris TaxID=1983395 RepID=UPI003B28B5D7
MLSPPITTDGLCFSENINASVIQRAALVIVEEAKDEFPNLASLVQSQKRDPVLKRSRSVISKVMSVHDDGELANGMTNIFKFSRSAPQLLQIQILPKVANWHLSSQQMMVAQAPVQTCLPMRHEDLLIANSFPARTVVVNLVYAIIICMVGKKFINFQQVLYCINEPA